MHQMKTYNLHQNINQRSIFELCMFLLSRVRAVQSNTTGERGIAGQEY